MQQRGGGEKKGTPQCDIRREIQHEREKRELKKQLVEMRIQKNKKKLVGKTNHTKKNKKQTGKKKTTSNQQKKKTGKTGERDMITDLDKEQLDEHQQDGNNALEDSDIDGSGDDSVGEFEAFVGRRKKKGKFELKVKWSKQGKGEWMPENLCLQDWGEEAKSYIEKIEEENNKKEMNNPIEKEKHYCFVDHERYEPAVTYDEENDGAYCRGNLKGAKCRICKASIVEKGESIKNKTWRVTASSPVWCCVNRKGAVRCKEVVCGDCFTKKWIGTITTKSRKRTRNR